MNTRHPHLVASLTFSLLAGFGCAQEDSTTPTPNRPMETTAVPVERAFQDGPCAIEGQTGAACGREGDFCPNGGYTPARLTCRLGTWRCLVDNTRSCNDRRASNHVCDDGDPRGPCVLGIHCLDGTPVPAEYQCVANTWLCQPVAPGCPVPTQPTDAGIADAGTPDSATPDATPPAPRGQVIISCGGPEREEASTDTQFRMRTLNITARGRALEVRGLPMQIVTSEITGSGHVFNTGGFSYFRNFRVNDMDTRGLLMSPREPIMVDSSRQQGNLLHNEAFVVAMDTTRHLAITADVAATENYRHDFTTGLYALQFGQASLPYVFYAEDNLRWADTNEPVQQSEIIQDANCVERPSSHHFIVVPRFADIIGDLGTDGGSTAFTAPGTSTALTLHFNNDGYETARLSQIVGDGTAIVDGRFQINLSSVVTDCRLSNQDGGVVGTAVVDENHFYYRDISLTVPGRHTADAHIGCTFTWPMYLTMANEIVIRFGIGRTNMQVSSPSGMGRIVGTLNLENNRVAPSGMSVTLRRNVPSI